jgi:hypothetical protein
MPERWKADLDRWLTTDPNDRTDGYNSPQARCAAIIYVTVTGQFKMTKYREECKIPYEDHDDETLGHPFVMPPRDERDY